MSSRIRKAFGLVSSDLQMNMTRDMDVTDAVLSGFFGSIGTNRSQHIIKGMVEKAIQVLGSLGSEHLADRKVCTLSTGEARRVLIARALVNEPKALVLDEPMNALDLTGKSLVMSSMRKIAATGSAVVLITHDPIDIMPEIDRIVMIKDGTIFDEGGRELLNERSLSELYDMFRFILKRLMEGSARGRKKEQPYSPDLAN